MLVFCALYDEYGQLGSSSKKIGSVLFFTPKERTCPRILKKLDSMFPEGIFIVQKYTWEIARPRHSHLVSVGILKPSATQESTSWTIASASSVALLSGFARVWNVGATLWVPTSIKAAP